MNVQQHHVGSEALALDPGGKGGSGRADLVVGLLDKDRLKGLDDLLLVVHNQDACGAAHQPIHGDPMVLHELGQAADGNAPVLGAGNPIALELPGVEPLAHGARRDAADLGNFPGRQYIFLKRIHSHGSLMDKRERTTTAGSANLRFWIGSMRRPVDLLGLKSHRPGHSTSVTHPRYD